ncbi:hypothetical protein GQ457_16G019770 [Hibiscus cannabinus]
MDTDLASLTIEDGEDEAIELQLPPKIEEVADEYALCLDGRFLTSSVVHFLSMRNTLANVWQPLGVVTRASLVDIHAAKNIHGQLQVRGQFTYVNILPQSPRGNLSMGHTNFDNGSLACGHMDLGSDSKDNSMDVVDRKKKATYSMKLVCWNVCGFGKPRVVNRLRISLRGCHPQILLLVETKLNVGRIEKVHRRCGFMFGIDVDVVVSRGGLSLRWKHDSYFMLWSYSRSHIDVVIKESNDVL